MPDQSMYDSPSADEAPDDTMPEKPEGETGTEENTALLPKSFFGEKELEIGKPCKVVPVHIYEDEVEVKYVPHDSKEDKPKEDMEPDDMGMKIEAMAAQNAQ